MFLWFKESCILTNHFHFFYKTFFIRREKKYSRFLFFFPCFYFCIYFYTSTEEVTCSNYIKTIGHPKFFELSFISFRNLMGRSVGRELSCRSGDMSSGLIAVKISHVLNWHLVYSKSLVCVKSFKLISN